MTTPLWDLVFGTRLSVDRVRVPRRLAMSWLIDESGEIYATYAGDYQLVGSRKRDEGMNKMDTAAAMENRPPEV